ncbi:TetR/AcrR family transcriptional regulator [Kocuria tytonicola]|uniref:TetR/AcrR family transcriptional regulator n=1 Tax=Kocuria tytonicola TaxID=2055946 RepID=A0A3L9L6S3_9MICC|nr:TetR/AcrR family transcriptional regulator [Kocuria tytonicola]RLY94510.1 TetR/AcrR family transcriptional regulator [Kocuria tytonicola]
MRGTAEGPGTTPTRERIAEAAIRVIDRQGFDVVSVRSVAQESGLSAGTVQYHFGSRRELLLAALDRSVERQVQRVAQARGVHTCRASLTRTLRELLPLDGVRHEDAAVWVSFGAAASTREWLVEPYWAHTELFRSMVQEALERAAHEGRLRAGLTPGVAAPLVTALVNGLTLDHLNAPGHVGVEMEAALDRGLSLIVSD